MIQVGELYDLQIVVILGVINWVSYVKSELIFRPKTLYKMKNYEMVK